MRCERLLRKFALRRQVFQLSLQPFLESEFRNFGPFRSSSITFRSNLIKSAYKINRKMSTNRKDLEESKTALKEMFYAGVEAVSPKTLIKNNVKFENGTLHVADQTFQLRQNVYLVGFGKAVMGMAIVLEHMLGDWLKKGIVSVPSASKDAMWESEDKSYFPKLATSVVEYREGGLNNQPDDRCLQTTHDIIDLVEPLTEDDTLIVLISGGGSALLYMPRPVLDQDDKLQLCKTLQNAGADIKELNTVRRKLSMVKGGGLARMAFPASIVTLMLSDIVGDPIDLIASGPTVYSPKAPEEVIAVLKKYNLYGSVEGDMKGIINSKEIFKDAPLLTQNKKQFKHVNNIILGNNTVAVEAARREALRKKLTPIILRNDITGDVHDVSLAYVHVTSLICLALEKTLEREEFFEKVRDVPVMSLSASKVDEIYDLIENVNGGGLVLIGGGEPTVIVKGTGKGGRNQELALHFSLDWLAKIKSNPRFSEYDVLMLSVGTDGQDGPTDAAGAFGYPAIGPLMHDLYSKIKCATAKEIAQAKTMQEIMAKRLAKKEQPVIDLCKRQELSGYLSSRKTELKEELKEDEPDEIDDETLSDEIVSDTGDADVAPEVLPLILQTMEVERMLPENTLKENDTYNFYSRFKKGADLMKTGFTGTNVMDLHFIYIRKRKCDCKINYKDEDKSENTLDTHDLYIDPLTIAKYREMQEKSTFRWDKVGFRTSIAVDDKADRLNIKIVDDNLQDPCCRKDRKFPRVNLLAGKDLPL